MKQKYFKYGIIACIIVALVGTVYVVAIKNKNKAAASSQSSFLTAEVARGDIKSSITSSGNVTASERKEVKAQDSGVVEEVFVAEGQKIEKGDLILTLESDLEETDIRRAELNLKNAQNELDNLNKDINNLKIYADSSGTIGEVSVKVGDEISDGYSLTTITDKSKMELTARFNPTQVANLKVGQKAEIVLPSSFQTITGTITKIEASSNATESGAITYNVIIEVKTAGGIIDGSLAQVTVINDKGSFSALEAVTLSNKTAETVKAKIGGEITRLHISTGDIVEKGELLAELKNPSLESKHESQNLVIEENVLNLNEKLKQKDNVAVFSPISGTVLDVSVTNGETINDNTVVAAIADLSSMQVVIPVDELDIFKVREGQQASVTAEALSGIEYTAEVTQIALEGKISDSVTTYDVTLTIHEPKQLKTGMTLNVELVMESKSDVLLLPIAVVQQQGKNRFVLQNDDSKENTTKRTSIEIGLVTENYVEITGGLNEGDVVLYAATASNSNSGQQRQPGGLVPGMTGGFTNTTRQGGAGNARPGGSN